MKPSHYKVERMSRLCENDSIEKWYVAEKWSRRSKEEVEIRVPTIACNILSHQSKRTICSCLVTPPVPIKITISQEDAWK